MFDDFHLNSTSDMHCCGRYVCLCAVSIYMLNYDNGPSQFHSLQHIPLILAGEGLPGVALNGPAKYTKIFMADGQLLR